MEMLHILFFLIIFTYLLLVHKIIYTLLNWGDEQQTLYSRHVLSKPGKVENLHRKYGVDCFDSYLFHKYKSSLTYIRLVAFSPIYHSLNTSLMMNLYSNCPYPNGNMNFHPPPHFPNYFSN